MSADPRIVIEVLPTGGGIALDLGGGRKGLLREPLRELGYSYVNLDIVQPRAASGGIVGDAQRLPFKADSIDLVVSKDTMEHFLNPWQVVREVRRVLKINGCFVIWVPFMHPFHGDDYYRYTPLGLKKMLDDFAIVSFDSPLGLFNLFGIFGSQLLRRLGAGFLSRPYRILCNALDQGLSRFTETPSSFAGGYRIVARKR